MMRREVATHSRPEHGGPHSARGGAAPGVMDFSSSIGPLGPPGPIVAALARGVETALAYPDPDYADLRAAIARARGVGAARLAVGCGATELIHDWCRAFVGAGTRVLVQAPTFSEYAAAARLCGGAVEELAAMELRSSIGEFLSAIPRSGCVLVCRPNNPTGELITRKSVLEIADEAARRGSQVLVDEAFIDFAPRGESVIGEVASRENLYVVHSLTKILGIPGVRVGYGAGSAKTARALRAARVPWGVSGLAQHVAMVAMPMLASASNSSHVRKTRVACQREKNFLSREIEGLRGHSCIGKSEANFVLVSSGRRRTPTLRDALLKRRILVRDCSSFSGLDSSHIRISVRGRAENEMLLAALRSA